MIIIHIILISILLSLNNVDINYTYINYINEYNELKPFIILNKIWKCSYSIVYDWFILNELKPCVIKVLKTNNEHEFEKEIIIMNELKDLPNIINVCNYEHIFS